MQSELEEALLFQLRAVGLPLPVVQYRAIPGRRWRWDFAWPERKLLVEVQGGIWIKSGHTTGTGISRDIEKNNAAVLAGWRVLFVTACMIEDGRALEVIEAMLQDGGDRLDE